VWKVLHVNDYPVGSQGGAEVLMERTLRMLRKHGVVTDVFTAVDLPDSRLTPGRYINNAGARRALAAKLHSFRPDIVHLHNFYHVLSPGILAELARFRKISPLRVVMTAHDYHLVCPNSGLSWFRRGSPTFHPVEASRLSFLSYLLTRCWDQRGWAHSALKCAQHWWHYHWHDRREVLDLVICPSRFATQLLSRTGRPTVWLPHPCPPVAPMRVIRPTRLRFVYAGRLVPEKGLAEWLNLLPDGLDAEWMIIGEGPEKERYLRILRARGLDKRVSFLGHLPHQETLAAIAASHVLVLPSRWPETYGLTLIEALAAGTNLLVSNEGAIQELVDAAKVGYVFTLDDKASLNLQIQSIQDSHETGTLNNFDVSGFLRERGEGEYIRRLLDIYAADQASFATRNAG
jgi:glycosyltransferase involved in cell wall biosynthesis